MPAVIPSAYRVLIARFYNVIIASFLSSLEKNDAAIDMQQ